MSEGPPARVFLRPIGSPLTLGMSGLAIASLVQSGLDLRWVKVSQSAKVGLILLAVAFVLQVLACVFAYLARDGAAGAVLGVLATTWLSIGLVHLTSTPGSRSSAIGLMLLAAAWMIGVTAIAITTAKPLPGLIFGIEALRFAIAGVYELGGTGTWRNAAGILGLVVLGGASYCVLAFELEGQQRRPVLPTFRRGRGRAAMVGAADAALDDYLHDAGVRQTT